MATSKAQRGRPLDVDPEDIGTQGASGGKPNPGLLAIQFKAGNKPRLNEPIELIGGNSYRYTIEVVAPCPLPPRPGTGSLTRSDFHRPVAPAVGRMSFELSKAGQRYFSGSSLSSRKGRNSETVGWIGKASRSTW